MIAPWPYDLEEDDDHDSFSREPTWKCPEGICECCLQEEEDERLDHRIFLFDWEAVRIPNARCRIFESGLLVNKHAPYAEPDASITVPIKKSSEMLIVEWAPFDTPLEQNYPFRICYYPKLHLGDEASRRRLHNIGFSGASTLEKNVLSFQHAYGPPNTTPTGRWEDIEAQLVFYHDAAMLPPLVSAHVAMLASDSLYIANTDATFRNHQGCAREARATEPFIFGIEVHEQLPWTEQDLLIIVNSANNVVFRQQLGQGEKIGALRQFLFTEYQKNELYTAKVHFKRYWYLLFRSTNIYDLMSPSTETKSATPPSSVFVKE